VAGVAVDGELERLGPIAADHDPDVAAFAVQHRGLLDVQLEIGVEHAGAQLLRAGVADRGQRVADGGAGVVGGGHDALQGQQAGEGHGTHHRRAEARALLVGPADHLDSALGLQTAVVERANHLQAAQHAEDSVIAAAADLSVEMAADGDRRQAGFATRAAGEDVAELVDRDLAAGAARPLDEEVAHRLVLVREGEAAQTDVAEPTDLGRALQAVPQPFGVHFQNIGGQATSPSSTRTPERVDSIDPIRPHA